MAGFFPHLSSSRGAYTALPNVAGTGILDSIVNDIGAGVNGWTVYDDQRNATGSYPTFYLFNNGMYYNVQNGSTTSWTSVSGANYIYGNSSYGYNAAAAMAGMGVPGGPTTDISFDGVNWYSAYYSAWPNNYVTATLDRNFAQASTFTRRLLTRVKKYVVLQCSSSIKTYYVFLGLRTGGPGGPFLFTQVYETWNSGTGAGTNGGQIECLWAYQYDVWGPDLKINYILAAYPESLFLWVGGAQTSLGSVYWWQTSFYVGNLNTTAVRATPDPDALWAGWSFTGYSGYVQPGGTAPATAFNQYGSSQCLRTLAGGLWAPVTDYHTPAPAGYSCMNYYMTVPQTRTYVDFIPGRALNWQGKFLLTPVDVWQNGATPNNGSYAGFAGGGPAGPEGKRGEIRYVKIPVTNPSGMSFMTVGPMQDGLQYIIVPHTRWPWVTYINNNAMANAAQDGFWTNVPSSWARVPMVAGFNYTGHTEFISNVALANGGAWYRYLAIPLL